MYDIDDVSQVSQQALVRDQLALAEERARIARDLHDHVIQLLFAAELSLQGTLSLADAQLAPQLSQVIEMVDDAISRTRASIYDLHAAEPANPLRARLRHVVSTVESPLGFTPELHLTGPIDNIAAALADDLIACLREALTNVIRHAHATHVAARIEATRDTVAVYVIDNGIGCIGAARTSGLANLAHRAEARGGRFTLSPAPGGGSELRWQVPS